jgi:hypothetical protein
MVLNTRITYVERRFHDRVLLSGATRRRHRRENLEEFGDLGNQTLVKGFCRAMQSREAVSAHYVRSNSSTTWVVAPSASGSSSSILNLAATAIVYLTSVHWRLRTMWIVFALQLQARSAVLSSITLSSFQSVMPPHPYVWK